MNYQMLKNEYLKGWHTWNVRSVLSHVHMPDGFALNLALKEYREGHYLKEALIGRFQGADGQTVAETVFPEAHAFDGSYTELRLEWCDLEIRVQSAYDGEDLVLLVEPLRQQMHPAMLVVEGGFLWCRGGTVMQQGRTLVGSHDGTETVVYTTGAPAWDPNIPVQTACLCVVLDDPVAISTGKYRTLEEVEHIVSERCKHHDEQLKAYGPMQAMYEALESALGWDTIYDPKKNRMISPVSRLWSINNGGYVLFCWDTFFAGFVIIQFLMLAIGLLGCKGFAQIAKLSDAILIPSIFVLCVVGSYAIHNNLVEVCIMFLFGILGYLARKFDLNPAAIVLGLILGPIGERGLRRSLMLNDGDPSILFSTPLCWILIILCVLGVMSPVVMSKLEKKVQNQ